MVQTFNAPKVQYVIEDGLLNFLNKETLFTVGRNVLLLQTYRRQDVLEVPLA